MSYTFQEYTQSKRNSEELNRIRKHYQLEDTWKYALSDAHQNLSKAWGSSEHDVRDRTLSRGICEYVGALRRYIIKKRTKLQLGLVGESRRYHSSTIKYPYQPLKSALERASDEAERLLDRVLFKSCYWHVTTTLCDTARSNEVGVDVGNNTYSRPSHFVTIPPSWMRSVYSRGIEVVKDGKDFYFVLTAKPVEFVWNDDPCITFYQCSGFTCKNQTVRFKDRFFVARYNSNGTDEFGFASDKPVTAMSPLASKAGQLLTRRVRKNVMDALAI